LAYKWIRILYRCWKTRQPYNPELYLSALLQRGSPYASAVNNSTKKVDRQPQTSGEARKFVIDSGSGPQKGRKF
jgi:hypothetical protein